MKSQMYISSNINDILEDIKRCNFFSIAKISVIHYKSDTQLAATLPTSKLITETQLLQRLIDKDEIVSKFNPLHAVVKICQIFQLFSQILKFKFALPCLDSAGKMPSNEYKQA